MNKNLLFRLTLVVTVVAALFLSGCGGDSIEQQRLSKEAEGMFVTMFICRLVLKLRRLEYCNAGHNPLPRRRRTQRRPHLARFQFYNLIVAKTVA